MRKGCCNKVPVLEPRSRIIDNVKTCLLLTNDTLILTGILLFSQYRSIITVYFQDKNTFKHSGKCQL